MTNILVTGASGQLGRAIQAISNQHTGCIFHFTDRAELDITNGDAIASLFGENTFDYCINCAAFTNVEGSEREPEKAYAVNDRAVGNLARECKEHSVTLIHISTDYVFDGLKESPYLPSDRPNPINEYGRSKWEGEKKIEKTLKEFYIVRTSWLYSEQGRNFYTTIVSKAAESSVIQVTDQQKGCPTHVNNLAEFILKEIIGRNPAFGIYHYTDGEAMTWFDFARKIVEAENLEGKVTIEKAKNYRTFAARPKNSVLIQS